MFRATSGSSATCWPGVGPVRSVLFVVAADEGWKPQSEEHLQILDVLGVRPAVVALTKRDLVDDETLEIATEEVRERLAGTGLADAPIVAVSSHDRRGIDALRAALDEMLERAPPPDAAPDAPAHRSGLHDQGRRHGGDRHAHRRLPLGRRRGRAPAVEPSRAHPFAPEPPQPSTIARARCPGWRQPGRHRTRRRRTRRRARPCPATWRPTDRFEATPPAGAWPSTRRSRRAAPSRCTPARPRSTRGSASTAATSSSRATTRSSGSTRPRRWSSTSAIGSSCAKRARQETVAGGRVLDVDPPGTRRTAPGERLASRARAERDALPGLLARRTRRRPGGRCCAAHRVRSPGGTVVGSWFVRPALLDEVERAVTARLARPPRGPPAGGGRRVGPVARPR